MTQPKDDPRPKRSKNMAPLLRLYIFFATESDRAVILRRGPTDMFRMILWHRDTDRFEDGQWLKHRVYEDLCDLSPDGRHFLFFALDGKWGSKARGSYTAISQPPYFTALVLHPQGDTWGGGGRFLSNTAYSVYNCDFDNVADYSTRLRRKPAEEVSPRGLQIAEFEALKAQKRAEIGKQGYRVEGVKLYRAADDTLIRDFTDMEFENIRAPYDFRTTYNPDERRER